MHRWCGGGLTFSAYFVSLYTCLFDSFTSEDIAVFDTNKSDDKHDKLVMRMFRHSIFS